MDVSDVVFGVRIMWRRLIPMLVCAGVKGALVGAPPPESPPT